AGAVIETVGGVVSGLFTVTLRSAVTPTLPAASRATALSLCVPFDTVVVSQAIDQGAAVSSAPRLLPSSLNCTPTTPTLSDALADTVTVPSTVAPLDGAVIETVGGMMSGLFTVTATAVEVVLLPAASRALAV